MPVDRSLLPPLPGKPAWYVENAPAAVDTGAPHLPHFSVSRSTEQVSPLQAAAGSTDGINWAELYEEPIFPEQGTRGQGRARHRADVVDIATVGQAGRLKRVLGLAGRLRG
jgi:hypothetical protein